MRISEQDYMIPGTKTLMEKGTQVVIPVLGIQRDPEIHENPLKFDPERFSPENMKKRHNFSSIAFGEGPRDCIGNLNYRDHINVEFLLCCSFIFSVFFIGKRFGMLQARLGIISILSKYEVSVCEKTSIPLEIDPKSFILQSLGDQYFRLTKRTKK